jgi:mannosyltransferase
MRLIPSAVMLGVALWGITGPSYWRDEGATLAAVQRPFPQLVRMLGHVDAVHGAYYMIMWPLVRLAGTGEIVTRLPSAVAMAVAAGLVAALGRRLVSLAAGLAAGLVFAVLPQISLYGQDARSYAMVTALGAAGSYLLVRAAGAPGRRRGWLTGYAACLGAMGALNIFGILLVAAHAVSVALACLRQPARAARVPLALGWLAAAAAAVALASPVLALGVEQRGTASWIKPPGPAAVASLWRLLGPQQLVIGICVVAVSGLAASALAGRAALRANWPAALPALAVPWLAVPPAILIGISFATPLYVPRYVLYCLPAAALLAGSGLAALGQAAAARLAARGRAAGTRPGRWQAWPARLGWAAGAVMLAVIALLGHGMQVSERGPAGHNDNIRRADKIVAANMRPGDAVIYQTPDNLRAAYPYGLARLTDIAQYQSPAQSGTLAGTTLPAAVVRQRITGVSRLWVVELRHRKRVPLLQGLGLRLAGTWHTAGIWLFLYASQPAA